MRALVIGGGVSGLTSAHALQAAGWEVTIRAREWPPHIVSSVAAAVWQPYQVAHPRAFDWALRTAERLTVIMQEPESGVRLVEGWEFHRQEAPPPPWATHLPGFRAVGPEGVPDGYVRGYVYSLPVIETPVYLSWLREKVERRGVEFESGEVGTLEELEGEWPLVVNCAGLGARTLVGDESLYPIRGQIVRLPPALTERFLFDESDEHAPLYIIPRRDRTVIGGTAQRHDWDTTVRPDDSEAILARAAALLPAIEAAPVLEEMVGLRPGRPTVRLEAEPRGETLVIHNYGHGGAGFTLSWGCAEEVVALSQPARDRSP